LEEIDDPDVKNIIGGIICFSHFLKDSDVLPKPADNITTLAALNCALSTPNGYEGIDKVIPVVLKDGRRGSINVQVKSFAKRLIPSEREKILQGMYNDKICAENIPRLDLIINTTPSRSQDVKIGYNRYGPKGVYYILIDGVSSGFASLHSKYPGLCNILVHLTEAGRVEKYLTDDKSPCPPSKATMKGYMSSVRVPDSLESNRSTRQDENPLSQVESISGETIPLAKRDAKRTRRK
jgi:hypothetical protein